VEAEAKSGWSGRVSSQTCMGEPTLMMPEFSGLGVLAAALKTRRAGRRLADSLT